MIKANELRIGNLVLYGTDFCEIKTIGNYQAQISIPDAMPTERDFEDLEPIPLTEEIISKTHFHRETLNDNVKTEMRKNEQGNWFAIIHLSTSTHLYIRHTGQIDVGGITHLSHIKYLHQLQNLFFSLIEKELQLTHANNQR